MKILTIGVPCYNSENYMEKCIDSLLAGGDDVEIIIVDDGSTDRTGEIADEYQARYPATVRVIHQKNGGHGAAVMTALASATGLYFKVVDSDDFVREIPYRKIMQTLADLIGGDERLDLLIANFVYHKAGEKRHRVMRYAHTMPVEQMFTWKDVGHFHKGQYILMHSVIYRTKLLRDCGMKLPEHTFYVDNLYVFEPIPFVKNMYYLDVNFYYYNIGREDQSVNESVMVGRVGQQIQVNRMMVDYFTENIGMISSEKRRYQYMFNYLEIMTAISSILLILAGTPDKLREKDELWSYIRKKNLPVWLKMRFGLLGNMAHLPGRGGRKLSVESYRLVNRFFHFN
ncbi:MAG: glycosyltransferase family 2 protein [Lachnospiraceae bacterium]|nr:glycosyltransferase family 2 protein [Lachnospiraceae bacterium]